MIDRILRSSVIDRILEVAVVLMVGAVLAGCVLAVRGAYRRDAAWHDCDRRCAPLASNGGAGPCMCIIASPPERP